MPVNTLNGGDFRQSVYRAIRHGLMQAHSMLLEPFYAFHLTIPDKMVGRAMTDLERRFAVFEGPVRMDRRYLPAVHRFHPWMDMDPAIMRKRSSKQPVMIRMRIWQTQAARSSVPTEPVSTVRLPHTGKSQLPVPHKKAEAAREKRT